jgi:hypothetical protein
MSLYAQNSKKLPNFANNQRHTVIKFFINMEKHTIYRSLFYKVLVVGCAVISLYGLFTNDSAFELIKYSVLLLSSILYCYSIKTNSKPLEWIVLIMQITVAILALIGR